MRIQSILDTTTWLGISPHSQECCTPLSFAQASEETVFRGYMFERLGRVLGPGVWAKASIVLLTSAVFALAHYPDQGLAGVEQAMVFGLTFGSIFAVTGGIWMPIFAHAAFDVVAVAIIYFDLEATVAHLVFR